MLAHQLRIVKAEHVAGDAADHAFVHSAVLRADNDALIEDHAVVMAADLFKADQSVLFDLFDDEADLVRVRGEHQHRAGMGAGLFSDQVAQTIHPDFIRLVLQAIVKVTDHLVLKAARTGDGNELFEKFLHMPLLLCCMLRNRSGITLRSEAENYFIILHFIKGCQGERKRIPMASSGFCSRMQRRMARTILARSPGRNGSTQMDSAEMNAVPLETMNHSVPSA